LLGNKVLSEEAIKAEMGADTTVIHKCGIPFSVYAEVNGKKGKMEGPCPPPTYYNNCASCGCKCMGGHEITAKNAAAIAGGAPGVDAIER